MMLLPRIFNDDFFDDFFETPRVSGNFLRVNNMRSDIKELDDDYQIEMQLPGYDKDEVEVEIKDGYLTVSANHEENKEDKDKEGKYLRKECYRGSCERSFYVGDDLKGEDVKAAFKNGMLVLTIPKRKELPKEEVKQLVHIE